MRLLISTGEVSGDLQGSLLIKALKKNAKERFINCGIAEANMMSVASGLALAGMKTSSRNKILFTCIPFKLINKRINFRTIL